MTFLFTFLLSVSSVFSQTESQRPDFKTVTVKIAGKSLNVELADTQKKRAYGLMFKKEWGNIQGMIFIFSDEMRRSFWMKNTFLPLSLGFFGSDGVLKEVKSLEPKKSVLQKKIDSVQSLEPCKYVLEVPKNWFSENNVKIGDKLEFL